ncbi:protein kinase domain-containing protein [Pseudonocardia sp. Cha107L01]|uniref:protein kinase domain-containing protein n=1 Tax=Pseudonocardia sp. Cha107L01 TaxID=3457576 RepID=UPI00403E80BE
MTGEMFGPYRLEELIGRGGMGEVYRAFDTTKARLVAVKRLPVSLSADASFQARFRREAEVTARLTEPHIIPIHDYGDIDGHLFLDMRLVTGTDLATVVAEQAALPPRRAAAIIVQIAAALDAAHTAGLVHRDIKPSNVLLTGEPDPAGSGEFAYLIDFGIASSLRDTALTQTGSIVGSAAYMAPERFTDHHGGDHRVDIYALGCVLYELLAGQVPFPASDMASYMGAHLHTPPPALERLPAEMTGPFNAVIARALSKDPALRYQTAGELATDAHTAAYGTTSPNPETLVSPTLIEHATRTPDQVTDPTHASTPPTTRPPQQTQHPSSRWNLTPRRRRTAFTSLGLMVLAVIGLTVLITHIRGASRATTPAVVTTIPVGQGTQLLAISPNRRQIYTSTGNSGLVSVIDTVSNTVVATIPVGQQPFLAAFSPDSRRAYITNNASNSVTVIDTASNAVTATIPVGQGPDFVALSPDGRSAYVTDVGSGWVTVIDTASNTITATIPVGQGPGQVALSPDGRHAYVGTAGSSSVSVIDTASHTITATIPVGQYPIFVALTPDGRHAYVTNMTSGSVSVIDTASNAVTATIPVGQQPGPVTLSPDASHAYIPNDGSNSVTVIDTATNTVAATIPVRQNPRPVTLSPDGRYAYVGGGGLVSVIDTANNIVNTIIHAGQAPSSWVALSLDGGRAYVVSGESLAVIDIGFG